MVVAEDGAAVAGPQLVPDGGGVRADAADEPLGVVVEGDVDGVAAAIRGAVDQGLQDGGGAGDAGAEVGVGEDLAQVSIQYPMMFSRRGKYSLV